MSTLLGLPGEEYRRYRVLLGLPPKPGRPAHPAEDTIHRVWQAWRQTLEKTAEGSAEHYLAVQRATGIPLRVIWPLTQQWIRRAEPVNIRPASTVSNGGTMSV